MDRAIIPCEEEEFGPFFSTLWRRRQGWRPVLFGLRGPAGLPFFANAILTVVGLWRFARKPACFAPVSASFAGRMVTAVDPLMGSYGMGGPAFLGLRMGGDWIVFTLWGATGWSTLNSQRIEEKSNPNARATIELFHQLVSLVGARFVDLSSTNDQLRLTFATKDDERLVLEIQRDGSHVPPFPGTGLPRAFLPDELLTDAVRISRTGRLWLGSYPPNTPRRKHVANDAQDCWVDRSHRDVWYSHIQHIWLTRRLTSLVWTALSGMTAIRSRTGRRTWLARARRNRCS
jgi:hypothetical protein